MNSKTIKNFSKWRIDESLSTARNRFLSPGLVDQSTFDRLKALDPTPTFKYLDKIIQFHLEDKPSMEDLKQTISRFHTLLNRNQVKTRDINAFKSFDQLSSEVQISDQGYSKKQETKARKKEYDIVHEDEDWIVVIPLTHEASCRYGAGTKWCTSAEDVSHYRTYTRKGVTLYYIISKNLSIKDRFYKMAVAVWRNGDKECFDSKDQKMGFNEVLEKSGLKASLFVPDPIPVTPYEMLDLDESKITENPDGSIDYDGDVDMYQLGLDRIPRNFRRVKGDFWCSENNLTSLEGAPKEVGGSFFCRDNKLTSLEGAPSVVGVNFDCSRNNLTSLEGAPKEVGGNFYCFDNKLTSLEGAPSVVGGDFWCYLNNQLTSLKGAPRKVGGNFWCSSKQLSREQINWARENIKANSYDF